MPNTMPTPTPVVTPGLVSNLIDLELLLAKAAVPATTGVAATPAGAAMPVVASHTLE